jgi:hypothetical protein
VRDHDHDLDASFRPKADRADRAEDTDLLGRAAVAGRPDVLGPAGLLGLQRTAGNSSLAPMMEESPVHGVINSGRGTPLPTDVRTDMETRFGGTDFSDVRVHTDSAAHASAKSVNAQAYTVGPNIVFQQDKYDPGSAAGQHMLAHELTHVVQQRSGPVEGTDTGGGIKVSDPSDRFEREASANADHLMSQPTPAPAPAVQRHEDDASPSPEAPVQREEAPEEEETAQTYVQREGEEEEAEE